MLTIILKKHFRLCCVLFLTNIFTNYCFGQECESELNDIQNLISKQKFREAELKLKNSLNHKNSPICEALFSLSLGMLYSLNEKQDSDAEKLLQKSLKTFSDLSLNESEIYLQNIYFLASLYDDNNQLNKSLVYFLEYLRLTGKIFSDNSFEYIKAQLLVADNYQKLDDFYSRNEYLKQSIEKCYTLSNAVLTNEQQSYLLAEIGRLYSKSDENEKAISYLKKSILIIDNDKGDNLKEIQYSYGYLITSLKKIGDYKQAEKYALEFIQLSQSHDVELWQNNNILIALISIYDATGEYYKSDLIIHKLDSLYLGENINTSDHINYLVLKARHYFSIGKSDQAREMILNADSIEKKSEKDISMRLLSLYNIANLFKEFEDYTKELEYRLLAREHAIKNKLENSINYFRNSIRINQLYTSVENIKNKQIISKDIQSYYLKSTTISDSILILSIKENYLEYLISQNQFKECQDLIRSIKLISSSIFKKNSFNQLNVLIKIANYYNKTGQYSELELTSNALLNIIDSLEHIPLTHKLNTFNIIAGYFYELKKYAVSKNILDNSEVLFSSLENKNTNIYADYLNIKSMVLFKLNDLIGGESAIIKSAEINKLLYSEKSSSYSTSLHNIGLYYQNLKNNEYALKYYKLALNISKEGKKTTLNNILSIYIDQKQFDSAKNILKKLENIIINNSYTKDSISYARLYLDYARYFKSINDFNSAYTYFIKAENILVKNKEIFSDDYGIFTNDYGIYFHKIGDNVNHLKYSKISYEQYLKRYLRDEIFVRRSVNYAFALWSNSQINEAESLIKEAAIVLDSILNLNIQSISISDASNFIREYVGEISILNSFLLQYPNSPSLQAILNLCLSKKSFSLNKYTKIISSPLLKLNDQYKNSYEKYRFIRNQISTNIQNGKYLNNKDLYLVQDSLERVMFKLNLVSKNINSSNTWERISNKLLPDEAVIIFEQFYNAYKANNSRQDTAQYMAYIIRGEGFKPKAIFLGNEHDIFSVTNDNSVLNENDFFYSSTNSKLYYNIWKKLEANLKGIKKVFISPAGKLNTISFAAIPLPNNRRIVDEIQVISVKNINNINDSIQIQNENMKITLFGGVDFDNFPVELSKTFEKNLTDTLSVSYVRGLYKNLWPKLPYTNSEVSDINKILLDYGIKTSLFTSNAASEEAFKNIYDADIIHVATHGYYSYIPSNNNDTTGSIFYFSRDPLTRSGLVFAGGNNTWKENTLSSYHEDGILTAREISTLDLSFCRLVVLSACETGLGDIQYDDDVAGLQRAFKMAGVKYIIASLWKVPDSETYEFMKLFYTNLVSDKANIKSAFYKTQLEMKNKVKQPSKWAAFVLIE